MHSLNVCTRESERERENKRQISVNAKVFMLQHLTILNKTWINQQQTVSVTTKINDNNNDNKNNNNNTIKKQTLNISIFIKIMSF